MADKDFCDGAVLVFGGSGGLGSAVARAFAKAGCNVAIVYRANQDKATSLVQEFKALGVNASAHATDVREPAQVAHTVADAVHAHGRIHTVVFGAGPVVEQHYLGDLDVAQWHQAIDTEVHGFFNVVSASLPHMRKQGGGSFVHLGSAGHLWWPHKDGLSVAPKAANEALVTGIAKEEGVHGIRANSVLVGVIEAGMFLELLERGVFDQAWIDETQKLLALKRWGKPEDVGNAAVFLASNKAGYITGQRVNVSGGFGI